MFPCVEYDGLAFQTLQLSGAGGEHGPGVRELSLGVAFAGSPDEPVVNITDGLNQTLLAELPSVGGEPETGSAVLGVEQTLG